MVRPLTRNTLCGATLAEQNGLCMVQRKHSIGWWLLLASSLTWFGCKHPGPRSQEVNKAVQESAVTAQLPKAPPSPVPLQIANPPAPLKVTPGQNQPTIQPQPNHGGLRA